MAKISSGGGVSGFLPFFGHAPTATYGSTLHPRHFLVTIVSVFLMVVAAAWTLGAAQQVLAVRAQDGLQEAVAFQPSNLIRDQLSTGYIGR